MEQLYLPYKKSLISYYRFGSGRLLILCFHGYGEDATSYQFLEKYMEEQASFISVDLPFHGKTEWNEGLNFSNEDLLQIITKILTQSNFDPKTTSLRVIGFSLGARVALSLFQLTPGRIERLVLLAPDGLKMNFWYWIATQTWIGKKLFSFTMNYPGWFLGFLKILNVFRLVNRSIIKFVTYYIGNKKARKQLYERWISLRKLKPDLKKIKSLIHEQKTETRLLYGKHDRIILSSRGEKFKKGIEEYCTVTIINSGHQVLHEKHAAEIVAELFN